LCSKRIAIPAYLRSSGDHGPARPIERKDVNTVLRETDEDINNQIEAAKAGK
jgi:hypothetical protein